MKILHICNDYCGSKVHMNLCLRLDSKVEKQFIYTYVDGKQLPLRNSFVGKNSEIIYDDILNSAIRKIYPLKMWWVYRHMVNTINPREIDCVFATTLFSDGGLAYKLYKKYRIPYIVAVRMTDFGPYLNHTKLLWQYGRDILQNAKKIILINRAYKQLLQTHEFSRDLWDEIKDRVIVRPNGIDSFWIDNLYKGKHSNDGSICYVGNFSKRKNVLSLIAAVNMLRKDYPNLRLSLIGEKGEEEETIKLQAQNKSYINLIGPIYDRSQLLKLYRQHSIFAMVSKSETFGLVYLEALSQNLRLLYSKGTGIDGMLDNVGVPVDANSVESIANGLRQLIDNYENINDNSQIDFSDFNWDNISDHYYCLFKEILST